jgi:Domain of unknown function (DUF4397)
MKLKCSPVVLVCRISLACALFALVTFSGLFQKSVAAQSLAFVRIVHASPDVGTANVFLDGSKLLSNFQFGTVTDYATIPPGPHKVQIALIGKGIGAAVISQTLSVDPGIAYTVAALGTKSTGFSLDVFTDNNQISNGTAKVRVYHLSPGTGTVNVSNGNSTLISGLAYPGASNYLSLQTGSYSFQVTTTQSSATLPTVPVSLKANTVTSIFAVGVVNGTPQIEFVTAQVSGLPGMPLTGSDPNPNAAPGESQALSPWIWLFVVLALIGIGGAVVVTRRLALSHRQVIV